MTFKRFEGDDLKAAFLAAFGIPVEEATPAMVVFFMKFAKYVRRFARNNSALHNYVRREFKHLSFKVVKRKSTRPGGKDWDALEISDGKRTTARINVDLPVAPVA